MDLTILENGTMSFLNTTLSYLSTTTTMDTGTMLFLNTTLTYLSTTTTSVMNETTEVPLVVPTPSEYIRNLNQKMARVMALPIAYVAIMMVIGLVGNTLVLYVYGFRWHRAPIRCFVTTLAVFDLINCLVTMPTEIATLTNFYMFDAHYFCKISRFSTFWMNNSSAVLLFVIAIDRFIKICMPEKKSFNYRKAKIICIVSAIIGVIVSWPSLVFYGTQRFPLSKHLMAARCGVANGMEDTTYPFGFYMYLWVGFAVITIIMSILYILIGVKIWMQKTKGDQRKNSVKASLRSGSTSQSHNDNDNVKELSAVSVKKVEVEKTNSLELSDDPFEEPSDEQKKMQVHVPLKPVETETKKKPILSTSSSKFRKFSRSISISKTGLQAGKATLMLVVITMLYVISFLPYLIISILFTLKGTKWYAGLSVTSQVTVQLFLRSYLISNTGNAIVYGCTNQKFKIECKRAIKKVFSRRIR